MPDTLHSTLLQRRMAEAPELYDEDIITAMQGNRGNPVDNNGLPHVPRPSMFQPDPLVVSQDQEFNQLVKRYLDAFPGVKEKVRAVRQVPDAYVFNRLAESNLPPSSYASSNLAGYTDGAHVYVQPDEPRMEAGTLMHELSHVRGYDERNADRLGERVVSLRDAVDQEAWDRMRRKMKQMGLK